MGRDATIDTAIVSITNAKNLGPSGAGAKLVPCPTLTVEAGVEFIVLEYEVIVEEVTCWIVLFGGGICESIFFDPQLGHIFSVTISRALQF
jgi:hypothetical protein